MGVQTDVIRVEPSSSGETVKKGEINKSASMCVLWSKHVVSILVLVDRGGEDRNVTENQATTIDVASRTSDSLRHMQNWSRMKCCIAHLHTFERLCRRRVD